MISKSWFIVRLYRSWFGRMPQVGEMYSPDDFLDSRHEDVSANVEIVKVTGDQIHYHPASAKPGKYEQMNPISFRYCYKLMKGECNTRNHQADHSRPPGPHGDKKD